MIRTIATTAAAALFGFLSTPSVARVYTVGFSGGLPGTTSVHYCTSPLDPVQGCGIQSQTPDTYFVGGQFLFDSSDASSTLLAPYLPPQLGYESFSLQVLGLDEWGNYLFQVSGFVHLESSTACTRLPCTWTTGDFSGTLAGIQTDPPRLPEPGTWAMMLLGFGGIGLAARRVKRRAVPVLIR